MNIRQFLKALVAAPPALFLAHWIKPTPKPIVRKICMLHDISPDEMLKVQSYLLCCMVESTTKPSKYILDRIDRLK